MAERYARVGVDNNRQGWGIAALVCLLAIGAAFGAWTVHKRTYQHPRTPINTIERHGAIAAPETPVG